MIFTVPVCGVTMPTLMVVPSKPGTLVSCFGPALEPVLVALSSLLHATANSSTAHSAPRPRKALVDFFMVSPEGCGGCHCYQYENGHDRNLAFRRNQTAAKPCGSTIKNTT